MTIFDIFQNGISGGVISGARKGFKPSAPKIRVGCFVKGSGEGARVLFQFTRLFCDHATQENLPTADAAELCEKLLREDGYAQAVFFSRDADWHITCYGRLKIRKQPPTHADAEVSASHDREKPSIIPLTAPFVKPLGLDKSQYADKLRQIEMYLALAAPFVPDGDKLRLIDFGCGRAYLTFAMYWYLTAKLGRECEIVGVDLKENVIAEATELANTLGYNGLKFYAGDAEKFDPGRIDMVFTLHACDLATDYALAWAVRRGAQSIVSVPCCQHELFSQLNSEVQNPLLRGIIRERTASLVTDAARAQLLEGLGTRWRLWSLWTRSTRRRTSCCARRRCGQPTTRARSRRWRRIVSLRRRGALSRR